MDVEGKRGEKTYEGISFLNQLVISLEESGLKLEQSYKREKPEQLKAIKEFIIKIQKKIAEELA
jgi:hypothetical protein